MQSIIIQKEKIVREIQTNLQNAKAVIFYDFHNIDSESLFILRKDLKKTGGFWKVYKNTLIKRALTSKKDLEFQQANALIFCQKDEYEPLKILNKFDQENFEKSKIKGGWYEEDYVSGKILTEWAKLPSKTELLQTLCYYLQWHLRKLTYLLEEIQKKKEKQS
ncbi:50S ribosomal protein L10 [endosymbiont GvMRE of Glomus versiforme]|uniref:50S ribosomal protein L10 n=1 Tax=endosymbiont GvMRE of Glomus versiforme TaxID=2039283 RepID=UPI000EE41963|nr:50S ribosomal protein L10 [endosymbiont GvMRE of Glomus versiforme]RHZ36840.1 50S ribosomal protein L10 [endosymbiont GvMRE of Glomus versiforme]